MQKTRTRAFVGAALVSFLSIAMAAAVAAPAGAATQSVSMIGTSFSPRTITIQQGDTVVWTNTSSLTHTVTADDGSFDSGSVGPGQTFSHTFSSAGTVAYHCRFHGAAGGIGMAGTIVVQSAAPATTSPRVTPTTSAPSGSTPTTAASMSGVPTGAATSTAPSMTAGAAMGASAATGTTTSQLPHTGSNSTVLALLGALGLVAGALVVFASRRRSHFHRSV